MIYEVSGDILLTQAQALAHGIAPNDHFDHGLALALREQWPGMYKDYRHYAHQEGPKSGEIWEWGGFGVRIFNLLTQEGDLKKGGKPGKANLHNLNECLKELKREIEEQNITSLALPRLATGIGSLDWDDVKPVIEKHLGHLSIPIYIYTTYHKGVKADEPNVPSHEWSM